MKRKELNNIFMYKKRQLFWNYFELLLFKGLAMYHFFISSVHYLFIYLLLDWIGLHLDFIELNGCLFIYLFCYYSFIFICLVIIFEYCVYLWIYSLFILIFVFIFIEMLFNIFFEFNWFFYPFFIIIILFLESTN